jgi:FkbM family methyltransferase
MPVFLHPRFEPLFERHPLVLVDVGARGGVRANWLPARPHLRVIGFEPEEREFKQLALKAEAEGGTIRFFNTALHNRRGPLQLFIAKDRGLTSMFEPDRGFLDTFPDARRFETVDVVEIEADTLDNVLQAASITDVDFVKVDTQGSELFVLEGGRRTLEHVVGAEVEVEFAPIYKGQPLFADVDRYMRDAGFALFDLRPCYWKRTAGRSVGGPRGQIIWADALYLRTLPSLRALIASLLPDQRTVKLLKAVASSVLYGYYDYALAILAEAGDVLGADDRKVASAALVAEAASHDPVPKFPGRRHVALAARKLSRLSVEPNDAWSVSDPELGNHR